VLRLITIPISHYCEKARWALERAAIAYREERHVQGIHRIAVRRAGGGSTAPVLVTPDGAIAQSGEIVEWVDGRAPDDTRLYPEDPDARTEVDALCRRFDDELGPKGRRLIYVHMFEQDRALALRFNDQGVPGWEDQVLRHSFRLAERFIEHTLGIRPGTEVEDEAAVFRELDFVAERLADGRPHLCGERFTAADLTFAALAGAVVLPPEYGVRLPQPDELAPRTAELVNRVREHQAGRYALAMFAEHRRQAAV
jgi:glutathione S-transferase